MEQYGTYLNGWFMVVISYIFFLYMEYYGHNNIHIKYGYKT